MGNRYETTYDGWPEHMSTEDYEIWQRWRPVALPQALYLWFDVGLGEGGTVPAGADQNETRMWTFITQKRADTLIEYPSGIAIVELRHNTTANAIGRLLMYGELWKQDPKINKPLVLILVSNRIDADVEMIAKKTGIITFVA